jgi:hypothetical protein
MAVDGAGDIRERSSTRAIERGNLLIAETTLRAVARIVR